MTREQIVALFEERTAKWRARDVSGLAAGHAPNAVVVSPTGGVLKGREEIERVYKVWFNAFPDFELTETDLVIEGNRAVMLATISGTHSGDFFGLPATGRRVHASCALVYTFDDHNLIEHERRILDFTGVLVQVGVLKAKPAAGL